MTGREAVNYYTFTAGPGMVRVTSDVKGGDNTVSMGWKILDLNAKILAFDNSAADSSGSRNVEEFQLDKKQKVVLKVVTETGVVSFKFQLSGAVYFDPVKSDGDENIVEISGDNDTISSQQICMPRNGVIIMTMKDGKKVKVDLSKVQKIEIQ